MIRFKWYDVQQSDLNDKDVQQSYLNDKIYINQI